MHAGAEPLTRWDLASGYVTGEEPGIPPLPAPAPCRAVDALADAMLPALRRPPCYVSFSGGRDSSAVLAVAAHAARRHGLPAPVPVTLRFAGAESTEESEWQELVIAYVGLDDWVRLACADEFDYLGDLACRALRTHGLQWPPNAHIFMPMLAQASGGSIVSGYGGDDLLDWRWGRVRTRLAAPGPLQPRALLAAGLALAPPRLRAARVRRTMPRYAPWLRPQAERYFNAVAAAEEASEPLVWTRRVDWFARRREVHVSQRTLGRLADPCGTLACEPLLDRRFLATLAAEGGRAGYGDRSRAMDVLFGRMLPPRIATRQTKAEFSAVVWGERARSFAAAWDGSGIDPELIDGEALRAEWLRETPRFGAASLLHQAWLATTGQKA